MRLVVFVSLLAAAGLAAAQQPSPQQPPQAPEPKTEPAPAPTLNLKLDNAARFSESTGEATSALPALGDSARPDSPEAPMKTPRPFPTDGERVYRQ